tara:strand:- start:1199 stop:1768 length:570 start_codon:yes stop_codon:yes gene_type:complete
MSLIPFGFWAASGGGGGAPAFDLLESTTLSTDTATVSFTGLDSYSDYKSLQIRMVTRADTSGFAGHYMQFNGDSAANYTTHHLLGNGSSVSSYHYGAEDYIRLGDSERLTQSVADSFAPTIVELLDFASTTKTTTARVLNGRTGGVSGASPRINLNSGLWTSTDAVTSVLFKNFANYVAGTRFSLYGVK